MSVTGTWTGLLSARSIRTLSMAEDVAARRSAT
jgi:hypothetical protein